MLRCSALTVLLKLTAVSSLLLARPPPAPASTVARALTATELTTLKEGSFVVIPSFVSGATAAALRTDALTLQRLSLSQDAVVAGGGMMNRNRVCQHSWLQNNDGQTPFEPAASEDSTLRRWLRIPPWAWGTVRSDRQRGRASRVYLDSLVATLEAQLSRVSQFSDNLACDEAGACCYSLESELAYLFYEVGGFFGQHFDTPGHRMLHDVAAPGDDDYDDDDAVERGGREEEEEGGEEGEDEVGHRRSFSFVLYLNEGWDERDGGQLEISPQISVAEQRRRSSRDAEPGRGSWVEDEGMTTVFPEAGTLVLFRSEAIPHRVVETRKRREAVVGWLHGPIDAYV